MRFDLIAGRIVWEDDLRGDTDDKMKLLLALDVLLWVLCTVRCDTLRVAWLAPEAEANYLKAASSMGGIALGIDQVEADTGLLTGTDFLWV